MRARMLKSPLGSASLLVELCVLTASCGASTPAALSPTLTPLPSPTATIAATATPAANAECHSTRPIPYVHLPGPLPTMIPVPPGTLVLQDGMSYPEIFLPVGPHR